MIKSALAFFTTLLIAGGAIAQNPPSNAAPQFNKSKNVWAGDNFEQVCTITATGSPGTFTPTCPSNNITITASGQTIALPTVGTPPGYQPGGVTKSVELNIFYTAPYVPVFASGYKWVNNSSPVQCSGGASGCLTGVVSPNPDLIECRTASETAVRCAPPLTAMGSGFAVVNQTSCASASGPACTSPATNMAGANLLAFCIGNLNTGGATSAPSDSLGNTYTQAYTAAGGGATGTLYFSQTTNVSNSMTFTASSVSTSYPGAVIMGFSGAVPSPLDQVSTPGTSSGSAGPLSPGSITPSQANELLITCLAGALGAPSTTAPFTLGPAVNGVSGTVIGSAMAYQIQSAATSQNPPWNWAGGVSSVVAGQVSFK